MTLPHAPWEEGYDFAIGLRPISEDAWLEAGEADPAARKDALLASARGLVWAETAGSEAAQAEVLALVEAAAGREAARPELPPLLAAARLVPDDLCLMERRNGAWRLTALSLCAGTFFTADEVSGKSLAELHGPVGGFSDRFLTRVTRIFEGLRPGLILERRNWTVVNSPELHTPRSAPIRAQIADIDPGDAGRVLHVRVERQTLRRLPQTGGALFTIRVWLAPLAELAEAPDRLAAFGKAWRAATPGFRAYKRFDLYDGLIEAFLAGHGV